MKRILAVLLVLMMMTPAFACSEAGRAKVVASFYPIYIFALNVFDGIDEISVESMTSPQTGCLHDYQLVVDDMIKLAECDLFLICGAGMEIYIDDVMAQFPALPVVDCSQGIELICDDEQDGHDDHAHEEHEHEGHSHAINAHTWLDVNNAIQIVDTIAKAGCRAFPDASDKILANANGYRERLELLSNELSEALLPVQGQRIVTFHEAFPYFAKAYGLEIAAVITQGHDESLSPARIIEVVKLIRQVGLPPLFAEAQYTSHAAKTIARETGAPLYELDPIVTGNAALTAYEDGMRHNASVLLDAFK